MGLFGKLFSTPDPQKPTGLPAEELARRLNIPLDQLRKTPVDYHEFSIKKRRGGMRTLNVPNDALKAVQRTILKRLLARLAVHPAAHGFEPGRSIVTNAQGHVGKYQLLKMDIREFFPSTTKARVTAYFRTIGWDDDAASLLTRLCTYRGGLPQGAPTSPRLSNLLNVPLDARLQGLANEAGATYTRYADDMTFSFGPAKPEGVTGRGRVAMVIQVTKLVLDDYGYKLHQDKKLQLRHDHEQQLVTGLVVNEKLAIPREKRRLLRAVAHHFATGRDATVTPEQFAGWVAFKKMVEGPGPAADAAANMPEIPT
jgi:retron-type reverse transcriptase